MDSLCANPSICNGHKVSAVVDSPEGVDKGEEEEETRPLLPSAGNGKMSGKHQKSSRRKVQWSDRNGSKLVEVLEFLPSDSSDSEDEQADSCTCTVM